MARIRTVKPEFWQHPKVTRVSRDARLLFLGLLNEADDSGKLRWSAKRLAGVLFGEDDDVGPAEVDEWCRQLERVRLVARYEIDGAALLIVIGFSEHQSINRPSPSRLPDPSGDANLFGTEPSVSPPAPLTDGSVGEGNGTGNREQGRAGAQRPAEWADDFATAWGHYPRKLARKDALKAYQARRREGISAEQLLGAVVNFAAAMAAEGRASDKVMHGATFFGPNERWKDYIEAPKPQPATKPEPAVARPEARTCPLCSKPAAQCAGHDGEEWDAWSEQNGIAL